MTHRARSVLRAATVAQRAGRTIDGIKQWALMVQGRSNHNKAACALANKLAAFVMRRCEMPHLMGSLHQGKHANYNAPHLQRLKGAE